MSDTVRFLIATTRRGALTGALCALGLQLPIEFLVQLDGLCMSLGLRDVIRAYCAAWGFYLCVGALAGGVVAFTAAVVLVLLRQDSLDLSHGVSTWLMALVWTEVMLFGVQVYLKYVLHFERSVRT